MRHAMVAASHWASTFPAEFDLNKPINFKGVARKWDLIDPHSWFHIDVKW